MTKQQPQPLWIAPIPMHCFSSCPLCARRLGQLPPFADAIKLSHAELSAIHLLPTASQHLSGLPAAVRTPFGVADTLPILLDVSTVLLQLLRLPGCGRQCSGELPTRLTACGIQIPKSSERRGCGKLLFITDAYTDTLPHSTPAGYPWARRC